MTKSNWTNSGTRPKRVRLTERRRRALDLRKKGLTFVEIAREVGYTSPSGAYEAVRVALDSDAGVTNEQIRKLQLARLETLLRVIWDAAAGGEIRAVDRVLKVLDRVTKLTRLDLHEQPDEPLPVKAYINFPMDDI